MEEGRWGRRIQHELNGHTQRTNKIDYKKNNIWGSEKL